MWTCCCLNDDPKHLDFGPPIGRTWNTQQISEATNSRSLLDAATTFSVTVDKGSPEAPVGMVLDLTGRAAAHVCDVLPDGPVDIFNRKETVKQRRIQEGDYIVALRALAPPNNSSDVRLTAKKSTGPGERPAMNSSCRSIFHLLQAGGRSRCLEASRSSSAESLPEYNSDTFEEGLSSSRKLSASDSEDEGFMKPRGGMNCTSRTLLRRIHSSASLQLEVRRPLVWPALMRKNTPGEDMGMQFRYAQEGISLVVLHITDGPVARWNAAHTEIAIERGDRIVAVNGQGRSPSLLMQHLSKDVVFLMLEISRPAPECWC